MKFKTEIMPWVDEIGNYLSNEDKKPSEIKKVLRSADLTKLSLVDKAKLHEMFDPRCEISIELFKRQLDLYFQLLEDKNPISIPIFSEYIEWICSQDIKILNDNIFDIIATRIAKSSGTEFPQAIRDFMSRLPQEYDCDIDKISNMRLNTLISVLKITKKEYSQMPRECQEFVKKLYRACAVKTEIADNNKNRFRGIFKDDPQRYYSLFNKAFAGVDPYEEWIDEPAKKITYRNMIKYANYQNKFLENERRLSYGDFATVAKQYGMVNQASSSNYLKEQREYKDYAKKMKEIFADMINTEIAKNAEDYALGYLREDEDLSSFAVTNKMIGTFFKASNNVDDITSCRNLAYVMIELIHLDELMGVDKSQIYDEKTITSVYDNAMNSLGFNVDDIFRRIENNACTPDDLPELYELIEQYPGNMVLQGVICDLEQRAAEDDRDEEFFKELENK